MSNIGIWQKHLFPAGWSTLLWRGKIEGDSTVDCVTYKKLYCSAGSEISEWNFEAPVREQDGKVWVVADGKEHLLHDFAVNGNWLYGDRLCFVTYKKRTSEHAVGCPLFVVYAVNISSACQKGRSSAGDDAGVPLNGSAWVAGTCIGAGCA